MIIIAAIYTKRKAIISIKSAFRKLTKKQNLNLNKSLDLFEKR